MVGELVWLHSPAVPRGKAAKFHCPWKGPYRVVKVLSDVTNRIQLVSSPQSRDRRRRLRLVVHFNRLKPCQLRENQLQGSVPPPGALQEGNSCAVRDINEPDEWTVPLPYPLTPEHSEEECPVPNPDDSNPPIMARGGPVWGNRLRCTVQAPDFYRPESGSSRQRGGGVVSRTMTDLRE